MSDDQETPNDEAVTDDDAALVAEVEELTKSPAEQQGDKVKNALIAAKRELRKANARNKELEPVAARASQLDDQLGKAMPIIDAVRANPKLLAEALRSTRTSADTTAQPDADEDPDAVAMAEDYGFYLADGTTPDAARARRILSRQDARNAKQTAEAIRPLAGVTLDGRADANLRQIAGMTDDNDVPFATRESIGEAAKALPKHMLSDPNVADLLLNVAIGIDRRKGRTPKPVEEPVFLDRQGGRRAPAAMTSEDRAWAAKYGISEKKYAESSKRLEEGAANRRGITLGSK